MKDKIFDALANEHRRRLLIGLLDEDPQSATVPQSAEEDSGALKTRSRLETELYHSHLPKLEEYGFIRWNRDTRETTRGPEFEEIRPLLEYIDDHV